MPDIYATLGALGGLAAVATALAAAYTHVRSRRERHALLLKIEKLLLTKTRPNDDSVRVDQIAAAFSCTDQQVIEAAARSKKIEPWSGQLGNEHRLRIKPECRAN